MTRRGRGPSGSSGAGGGGWIAGARVGDRSIEGSSSSDSTTGGGGAFFGDSFGVVGGGPSSWVPKGWSWIGSGSGSGSGSDSGIGAGEGDFCLTGALDGPARELDFPEVEVRDLDFNEATSAAGISTISESSSDTTTGFLPLRTDCLLGFSVGTTTLDGSGLGWAEDLADLRVGTDTSSTSSSSSSLTTTEVLVLLVLAGALELAADRPFRGGSGCIVSSLTTAGSSLAAPRLRFTGGGESSTGCSSSSDSGTPLSTVFDRVEVRAREVADGGFVARDGGFSAVSLVVSPSTSDRPRFLRDVEAFSSGGMEADADRVARRGGMDGSRC